MVYRNDSGNYAFVIGCELTSVVNLEPYDIRSTTTYSESGVFCGSLSTGANCGSSGCGSSGCGGV